ncbi:MAG TPA: ABC transporter ATP-binding protein [Acidimicrobiia bacterium]|nr:ABC transporter ATP-binding protein [Acidimicrobiia bacterium]
MSTPDSNTGLRTLLRPYLRRNRGRLAVLSSASLLGGFAEAAVLVVIARVAFAITQQHSSVTVSAGPVGPYDVSVPTLITLAAVATLVRLALNVVTAWEGATITSSVLARVRSTITRAFMHASWGLQSSERQGHVQELLTVHAVYASRTMDSLVTLLVSGLSLVALLVSAIVINAVAAVVVGAAVVLLALVMRPLRGAVRHRSRATADADVRFATSVSEVTTIAQEIKIFDAGERVRDRVNRNIREQRDALRRTRFLVQLVPGIYQGTALFFVVVALAVVYEVGFSRLSTLGAVVLILLRSLSFGQNMQTSYHGLNEGAPYMETLLSEQRRYEKNAVDGGHQPVGRVGVIKFDGVEFAYQPGRPVLHDLSFDAQRGEVIGIVGPSGAGKSTLVQLLLRLRQPTSGRVLADGRDLRQLALAGWYQRVSFVPQEPRLFSGSVGDNIRFFRDVTADEIVRAAKLANIHDEIRSWPRGYATPVGERGGELSLGQRQRLCIARSLVGDPDVLVLDEPTSSLDPRSEVLVREALATLAPNVTLFIIAHRLSTLDTCDRIMVLHSGRLQGFDEPRHLEDSSPFYREALRLSGLK